MSGESQDQSWVIARETAKKMGYVPIAFSQAIRMLVTDHIKNKGQLRAVTKYQISRLFRSGSFKSTIYYASKDLRPDFLANTQSCSVGDLVNLYSPMDLAAFITCFFLNRQMKKIGGETWGSVAPFFSREATVGALVGTAIPKIGHGPGLLMAGLRNVAHCLLSLENPDSYRGFRSKLTSEKKILDEKHEVATWRTTGSQVSSLLLANLGYMSEFGDMIGTAQRMTTPVGKITDERLREFRLAYIWHEAFLRDEQQPFEKLSTEFFPLETDRAKIAAPLSAALEGTVSWLDRTKDDLGAQETPHFFAKKKEDPNLEIPEELKDVFSIDELSSMEEEDFDALIDQIDAETKASAKRTDVISQKDLDELQKSID